jgi:hypothetical protein
MNTKNHTGYRFVTLQGDASEVATYAHSRTFPWFCKNLPAVTAGRLANYLVGFIITAVVTFTQEGEAALYDSDDMARALFESVELKNTLFGKPISHNYYKGSFIPLGGFVGNGMRRPVPMAAPFEASTAAYTKRLNYFIPACSLLGLKGHHTAQLACCYDGATFEIKTAAVDTIEDIVGISGELRVTAVLLADPEIRLGPGTSFVRYEQVVGASATKHMIEALGNTSALAGCDTGAGIAFLAWMTSRKGHGGSFDYPYNLEYVNLPFRGLDQLVTLDGLFLDYLGACNNADAGQTLPSVGALGGPLATTGCLYDIDAVSPANQVLDALFVPLVSPKRFMEVTKLQSVEGTVELNAKLSIPFSGQDVFYALQYHSWTPAMQENFLRKVVDSGVARAVWGTNDLQPKTKLINKQPAGGLNLSKTRYLPLTWEPKEQQNNPPGPASAK